MQLITQLWAWRSSGEGIILFIDMNENAYMGPLSKILSSDDLHMEE
jgi:hypothetical protein